MRYLPLIALFVSLAVPSVVFAQSGELPSCQVDPDVSCVDKPGEISQPTYESGQYPEGWAKQHYADQGQDEYGRVLPKQPVNTDPAVSDTPAASAPAPVAPTPALEVAPTAGVSTDDLQVAAATDSAEPHSLPLAIWMGSLAFSLFGFSHFLLQKVSRK